MEKKFKVVTNEGGNVNMGEAKKGLTEAEAQADAAERNARAEAMGIRTRYTIAPLA